MSQEKKSGIVLSRVGALLSLLLTSCATPWAPQSDTYGKIVSDLKQASQNKATASQATAINEALLPPLQIDAPRSAKSPEPRFDLSVSAAPVSQVFMAIVDGTRYSMLLPPDLAGSVTLNLKDVTIRQALDTMRDLYGYDYKVEGTRITVFANTFQTRLFQVSYLASKRGGTSSTRVNSSSGQQTTGTASGVGPQQINQNQSADSANVFTGVVNDFWFDLSQAVGTVLSCDFETSKPVTTSAPAGGQVGGAAAMANQLMAQRLEKSKCPEGRSFFLNAQSGVVMVRAMPNELREIGRLLKAMQANIERQVMLEAKIIDVQLNDDFQTGINWAAFNKNGGQTWSMNGNTDVFSFPGGRPAVVRDQTTGELLYSAATLTGGAGVLKSFPVAGGALGLAFQAQSFASLINFLQTQGTVYVMSSPRIATINNQKAVIKVGSDDYYITSVTPPSSTSNGSSTPTTNAPSIQAQPFFSGISLDVTPQIDEGGSITLHIRPSITDVSEKNKVINFGSVYGSFSLPYASVKVKESDSIVRVRDGMIVAIGGMMTEGQTDTANKVPGAGDVPGVGHLFKQTGRTMNKRELVILLKPTLIEDDSDWRQDLADTEERMQQYDPKRFRRPPDVFKQ